MANTLLITGGTGFVGQRLIPLARARGFAVIAPTRAEIGDLSAATDWKPWLGTPGSCGIDAVIHLAGRAHVMHETLNPEQIERVFHQVNAEAVAALASQCSAAGVRRFVLVSSAKVFGEGGAFAGADPAKPEDAYGRSKAAGEHSLLNAVQGSASTMSSVILRPPVIYGPGVKGNIARLARLARSGLPLPLGGIANRRSMIGLDNFCSALLHAIEAEPGTYAPSDQDDVSTTEFLRRLARAKGRPSRLIALPPGLLRACLRLAGRGSMIPRLMGDFTVDGVLPGWVPETAMSDQLRDV